MKADGIREYTTFEKTLDLHGNLIYPNTGVSMLPLLRQGRDLMVIEKRAPGERCQRYDAVLFKRDNGQYVLHRILKVREQDYYIAGDNCFSGEYVEDGQILGIMTEVIRDGKTVPVTDLRYRIYVHLWCDCYPVRMGLLWGKSVIARIVRRLWKSRK